ncbi:hypothetical protein [Deinococcus sp.]
MKNATNTTINALLLNVNAGCASGHGLERVNINAGCASGHGLERTASVSK